MSNSNWIKQAAAENDRRDNHASPAPIPASPATETELEAIRYRGAPMTRAMPPGAPPHNHNGSAASRRIQ